MTKNLKLITNNDLEYDKKLEVRKCLLAVNYQIGTRNSTLNNDESENIYNETEVENEEIEDTEQEDSTQDKKYRNSFNKNKKMLNLFLGGM